jgi:hypothetical protein
VLTHLLGKPLGALCSEMEGLQSEFKVGGEPHSARTPPTQRIFERRSHARNRVIAPRRHPLAPSKPPQTFQTLDPKS